MIKTHNLVVDFGKHKGQLWTRLPISYLKWLINERTQHTEIAKAELKRRGTVLKYEIEISGHAIDRASFCCYNFWYLTRKKEEGLHSWLHRMSVEALKTIGNKQKTELRQLVLYKGMRFVFKFGEIYPVLLTVMQQKNESNKNKTNQKRS